MRSLHNVIYSLLILIPWPAAALQLSVEVRDRVDAVFAEFDRTSGPGCAVGVAKAGRLVYGRGYGIGQMDHRIPLSAESVFYLASVSKQFAAAAVTIAEHEGHLSLDDDIRTHIAEFPDYAQGTVTIRHLVHHTSGVRDYLALMNLAGEYYSPELDVTWVLVADGGDLVLHHPSGNARALTALGDSVFAAQGAELAFQLDGGRATAFMLEAGRVRNLRFERVEPRE